MESQYISLIKTLLEKPVSQSRNGPIRRTFGVFMSHDLSKGFPLLTTKRVFFRGILEELAWFLRGSTNVAELHAKKVHIWDANTAPSWDAGPIYGFQWRHFGADYIDCKADYSGKGVDQIQRVINLIKRNPDSRRIFMSAWNPLAQDKMSLPPCHVSYQFYVNDGKLSCLLTQRSADVFLGLPFNIASTALLTHLIAHETDLEVGKVMVSIGNAHVYENHVDACRIQIERKPFPFPSLSVCREKDGLWNLQKKDVVLKNYVYHSKIFAPMAA